jgi:hypothetical protein
VNEPVSDPARESGGADGPVLEKAPDGGESAPADGSGGSGGSAASGASDDASGPGEAGGAGSMAQSDSAARYEPGGEADGPDSRFWSVRRVPATVVAAALLAAAGLLLYDVVSVRAERPAAGWRRTLAEELDRRTLDDGWVVVGAVAAMLLGGWLIVMAVSPGLRGLLPMRRENERLRAGIEHRAAAVVLRDRAMDVSGVRSVRVRVGRTRVRVWAQAHFRELDEVRTDLDAVVEDGIRELGLARQPALTVHVRRPAER